MRTARKLLLLATMAAAALALTATTATAAPIHIETEPGNLPCPTLIEHPNHDVEGGCHGTFESDTIPLFVHTGTSEVQISNCAVNLEVRVRENGTGHVARATLTPAATGACTRAACDEPDGTFIPWPLSIIEHGPNSEEVESTFCLRTILSGPGGPGTQCEIHLPLRTLPGVHMYEVGDTGGVYACENNPAIEIEMTDHLEQHEASEAGEALEIKH